MRPAIENKSKKRTFVTPWAICVPHIQSRTKARKQPSYYTEGTEDFPDSLQIFGLLFTGISLSITHPSPYFPIYFQPLG